MKLTLVLAPVTVGLLLTGCGGSSSHPETRRNSVVRTVALATAERSSGLAHEECMGTVVARHRADIETKVQARVERIPVTLGTRVRAGDLLVELDTREFQAHVQQARAIFEQAAQDLARFETLLSQNAATRQEFDAVKARHTIAAAGLEEAEAMLSYARITAPFAGTVSRKTIDVGDLAIPGRPLFVLEDQTSLWFVAAIPESRRNRINVGDTLTAAIPTVDTVITGTVEELAPADDPISRTFVAKIGLTPFKGLRAGQFGRLRIPAEDDGSAWIPASALVRRGQLEIVYVVTGDQRARLRLVRSGRQFQGRIEILSGLSEGERVVISDQTGLTDGDRVEEQS